MSAPDGGAGDPGEGEGDRPACVRLPAFDLEAEGLISVIDDRADRAFMPGSGAELRGGIRAGWGRTAL